MKIPRILIAAPFAFVITFILFLGMRALIEGARRDTNDAQGNRITDFIRVPTETNTIQKVREKPKRQPPPKQPPPPQVTSVATGKPTKIEAPQETFKSPGFGGSTNFRPIGGLSAGSAPSDSEATPIVRVNPMYPQRAAERGVEGFVTIKFKVGTAGQVVNPKVVASDPPGVFDRAALKAVRKWKYKPKIVDGTPIEYGVTPVKLQFTL